MAHARPATLEDANQLGPRLREADKLELRLSCGMGPCTALSLSFQNSKKVYTAVDDEGKPFAMFGVAGDNPNLGIPWMLGSDGIYKHASQFIEECKGWLDELEEDYELLMNYVHADNTKAIRWLKWMGFTMVRLVPEYGDGKAPFYEFCKVKQHV